MAWAGQTPVPKFLKAKRLVGPGLTGSTHTEACCAHGQTSTLAWDAAKSVESHGCCGPRKEADHMLHWKGVLPYTSRWASTAVTSVAP